MKFSKTDFIIYLGIHPNIFNWLATKYINVVEIVVEKFQLIPPTSITEVLGLLILILNISLTRVLVGLLDLIPNMITYYPHIQFIKQRSFKPEHWASNSFFNRYQDYPPKDYSSITSIIFQGPLSDKITNWDTRVAVARAYCTINKLQVYEPIRWYPSLIDTTKLLGTLENSLQTYSYVIQYDKTPEFKLWLHYYITKTYQQQIIATLKLTFHEQLEIST
jgi:hypothetical protein